MIKTGEFKLERAKAGGWRMATPVSYTLENGVSTMIPVDFVTDLRVGPVDFQNILVLMDQGTELLTLCDWLYSAKPYTKDICDWLFYEACRHLKVSYFTSRRLRKLLSDDGHESWAAENLPQPDRLKAFMS